MTLGWLRLAAIGALVAAVGCLKLSTLQIRQGERIDLTLRLGAAQPSRGEPLVVAGKSSAADFLFVRYEGDDTVRVGYDCWGRGGPISRALKVAAGEIHRIVIDLPKPVSIESSMSKGRLRVEWDGHRVLDETVSSYPYGEDQLTIGENRAGGTSCEARFGGVIARRSIEREGELLRRILAASAVASLAALGVALVCLAVANWRSHRWFILASLPCLLAFAWIITEGTFHFLYPVSFGSFYDEQARSLLHGHWNVPYSAIGSEAFVVHGKNYGYFGPVPAVLRMPFVLLGLEFGRWSRLFMTAEAFAALWGAYALLRRGFRLLRGPRAEPSPASVVLLTFNVGLGSTVLFLASRAYTYHEAILSSVAFALWSAYFTLGYFERPGFRRAVPALLLGLGALHCRPTEGLFALGLLGGAALLAEFPGRSWRQTWPARLRTELLCLAAFLTFNVVSYLKFGTLDGMPQRYNPQFMSDPARWERIGHANFHLCNARFNALGYFVSFKAAWLPHFPYLVVQANDPALFPEVKYDIGEALLALPYAMPGLFILAAMGLVACRPDPRWRRLGGAVILGTAPVVLVLLAAIGSSHRYTADFLPALVCFGALALIRRTGGPGWRLCCAMLALLTLAAFAVSFLMAMYYQGEVVWGVPPEGHRHYQDVARWFDRLL